MFLKNPLICLFILFFLFFINAFEMKKNFRTICLILFSIFIISLEDVRTAPFMIGTYLIVGLISTTFKQINRILLTVILLVAFIVLKDSLIPNHVMGLSYFGLMIIGYFYRNPDVSLFKGKLEHIHALSFFGAVTAGPIQEIEKSPTEASIYYRGFFTIALGVIHLTLGEMVSDVALETFSVKSMSILLYITHAFSILSYMYFDFQGYTLLAIGLGQLFHLNIPENFDSPYFATSIRDFWKRWHITLSHFFMNQFYMPLQVFLWSRYGKKLNISSGIVSRICFIGMWVLIGLWHSVNAKFLVWGLFNAFLIYFTVDSFIDAQGPSSLKKLMLIFLNMVFVWMGQILFLSKDLTQFASYFQKINFSYDYSELTGVLLSLIALILCFTIQGLKASILRLRYKCETSFWWFWLTISLSLFFTMYFSVSGKVFIYSRF